MWGWGGAFEGEEQMSPAEKNTGLDMFYVENGRLLHILNVSFLARWLTQPTQALGQFSLVLEMSRFPTNLYQ